MSFKKILKDQNNKNKNFDVCFRTNKLIIHAYQFLRLWILIKYSFNIAIPEITTETIKMVFKSLMIDSRGPKPKGNNMSLLTEFNKFYEEHYKNNGLLNKIDGNNLSQILEYSSVDMLTNIENNVKLNFFKYVYRFVNSSFKKIINDEIEKTTKNLKKQVRKELNKQIYLIKQDLLNNTLNSNKEYHEWINKHRNNIFPVDYKKSYEFDVENNPQKYIKSMIYMCSEIEKLGTKSFQFFPLRTDVIIKNIQLDTKSLIEIFVEKNKNDYLKDIEKNKNKIWSSIFHLDKRVFRKKNHSFNYMLNTDCYSVSIHMINNDKIKEETKKKENMKKKKAEMKEKTKGMTEKEKEEYKEKEKIKKDKKEEEYKLKKKEEIEKKKEEFKKLPKEEKEKILKKLKEEKIKANIDCKYIDELDDKELKELDNNDWAVIDVGIRVPLYIKNKKGLRYRYSNRKHAKITKRFKYQKKMNKYKEKQKIKEKEKELSNYNSKTVDLKKFKEYILNKNKINNELFEKYNEEIFRRYKWYGYLNKRKGEEKLIKELKEVFGKNVILILGDASLKGNCKRGNISTPSTRYKKLLMRYFKVYNIDEFRTSKLHHITEEECENLCLMDKNKIKEKRKERKIHAVLTYKMENRKRGCINRDENAVNNMIKIVKSQIEKKERPLNYRREEPKSSNTNKK